MAGGLQLQPDALLSGRLPRLQKQTRWTNAAALGLGLGFAFLARPFESTLLGLSAALFVFFLIPKERWAKLTLFVVIAGAPSAVLFVMHNHAVTGNWLTMPYMLNRYEYGVPATFTFQENPVPHRPLTVEQQLVYEAQVRVHGTGTDTPRRYVSRFLSRLPSYRFFFDPVLYIAVVAFIPSLRSKTSQWVLLTVLVFMLGTTFYPHFYPHYIAPLTGLFVLLIVIGLRNLDEWRPRIAQAVVIVYVGQFLFLYGIQLYGNEPWMIRTAHFSRYINWGDPQARLAIKKELQETPGNHLVFIQEPPPQYRFISWMQNGADIDHSRVVWARDLGAAENEQLKRHYSNRVVWLLKTDVMPPRLERVPTDH